MPPSPFETRPVPLPSAAPPGAPPTRVRYAVLAAAGSMAVLLYLDRFAISVAQPDIVRELGLTKSQMGWAVSCFFFAYALAQVPAGWLADRWGPRFALSLYVGGWSLAIAGVGLSRSLPTLIAARLALGLAQAGAYPAAAGLVKQWLPAERRGAANGLISMGGRAGGLLANILTPTLMSLAAVVLWPLQANAAEPTVGLWRPVLLLYGALGWVWAGLFCAWFRNTPAEHQAVNDAERSLIEPLAPGEPQRAARRPTPWPQIFASRNVWLLCLVNFFVNVGWIFLATWLPTYLREVHHVSLGRSGWLTAGTGLAGMAGCFSGGWATDRFARRWGLVWGRRVPGLLSCGGAAAAYLVCYFSQSSTALVIGVLAAAYFFADLVLGTVWTTYQDIGGGSVGVVLGFANMCGNLGAWAFAFFIGYLAENDDWSSVMLIAAGSFAAAMACWLFIDPRVPIVRATAPQA